MKDYEYVHCQVIRLHDYDQRLSQQGVWVAFGLPGS